MPALRAPGAGEAYPGCIGRLSWSAKFWRGSPDLGLQCHHHEPQLQGCEELQDPAQLRIDLSPKSLVNRGPLDPEREGERSGVLRFDNGAQREDGISGIVAGEGLAEARRDGVKAVDAGCRHDFGPLRPWPGTASGPG